MDQLNLNDIHIYIDVLFIIMLNKKNRAKV